MSSGPPYQDPYGQQQPPYQGQVPPQQVQYPHPPMPPQNIGRAGKYPGAFPCPRCGSPAVADVKYTWWGGLLGPSMFKLVKCGNCRLQYNAQTQKDPTTAIIIYNVVVFVVAFAIGFGYYFSNR